MKQFENLDYKERKEIAALFSTWLKPYTQKVIVTVLERRTEIINNDFAMSLMRELKEREEKEAEEFNSSIHMLLEYYDDQKEFNPHNHALTHSGSYRDILYDMYIKSI